MNAIQTIIKKFKLNVVSIDHVPGSYSSQVYLKVVANIVTDFADELPMIRQLERSR